VLPRPSVGIDDERLAIPQDQRRAESAAGGFNELASESKV